jgi:hypothetical protein
MKSITVEFLETAVALQPKVWVRIGEVQAKEEEKDDLEFDDQLLDLDSLDVLESKIAF